MLGDQAARLPCRRCSRLPRLGVRQDEQPRQGAGQRLQRTREVDLRRGAVRVLALQAHLRALAGALGALPVDLLRPLGVLGKDHNPLGGHLGEPAADC
jgi:hypothetical protein